MDRLSYKSLNRMERRSLSTFFIRPVYRIIAHASSLYYLPIASGLHKKSEFSTACTCITELSGINSKIAHPGLRAIIRTGRQAFDHQTLPTILDVNMISEPLPIFTEAKNHRTIRRSFNPRRDLAAINTGICPFEMIVDALGT